jgi:hypothetical protein
MFVVVLFAASCSKTSDPHAKDVSNKTKTSEEIVATDHNRAAGEAEPERSKAAADSGEREEIESQPSADDIAEDCYAFVWLTKATLARGTSGDCPQCPSSEEAIHVLKFETAKVDRVSCTEEICEATVTIRASFNPSKGGTISGGLTGWIPPEQREQYSRGQTPPGEKVYHVNIIYKRKKGGWRAVDFG